MYQTQFFTNIRHSKEPDAEKPHTHQVAHMVVGSDPIS